MLIKGLAYREPLPEPGGRYERDAARRYHHSASSQRTSAMNPAQAAFGHDFRPPSPSRSRASPLETILGPTLIPRTSAGVILRRPARRSSCRSREDIDAEPRALRPLTGAPWSGAGQGQSWRDEAVFGLPVTPPSWRPDLLIDEIQCEMRIHRETAPF